MNNFCIFNHIEWKEITTKMFKAKNALHATHINPPPYLLNKLLELCQILELIQRALEIYLESKRQLFPRFYFISNDDLLEVHNYLLLILFYVNLSINYFYFKHSLIF